MFPIYGHIWRKRKNGKRSEKICDVKFFIMCEMNKICPVCKSALSDKYIEKEFQNMTSTWFKCASCGTVFIWPAPGPDVLSLYYKKNYKDKKCPNYVSHEFRFSEENRKTVFNEYNLSLMDVNISIEQLRNKKILDYGCANGFFLDFLLENNCNKKDLYGFDIAEDLLSEVISKGYRIHNNEKKFFDFIFLWDVLEHIPDPREVLRTLIMLSKDGGGKLVVQTPMAGILSGLLGTYWAHLLIFEHVILYSRESLILLLKEFGFQPNKVSSFGANCPSHIVPEPYKSVYDRLVKLTDCGSTQIGCFDLR